MDLETSVKGMLSAQEKLRSREAIDNPVLISREMYRLAQYATAVENELAVLEEAYENQEAQIYSRCLNREQLSATAAEKHVKIELGKLEGQLKYLSRITGAAWRLHGDLQSRVNHITQESKGAI